MVVGREGVTGVWAVEMEGAEYWVMGGVAMVS